MWNIEKVVKKGDYLYAVVRGHPYATKYGYVLMHRVVMENHLGRLLDASEIVHHKDGNKFNNNVNNLEVMTNEDHVKHHRKDALRTVVDLKCPWCGAVFTRQKCKTHLTKPSKLGCTCCSARCRGKLSAEIQYHGLTHKLETAISGNVLTARKENRAVTANDRNRRDYTQSTCNGEEIAQPTT